MTLRHDHVLRTAFLVTGALGLTAAPLSAGTLHVPGDAATIQQAINAASGGDTILVAPGTYVERIDLLGKKLIVQSTDGAAVTTINGAGGGTVVTVDDVSPPGTMLRGFTITGGAIGTKVEAGGTSGSTVWGGGGIFVGENSSLQIDACVISGNTIVNPAYDVGGGVGAAQAAVTLTGCTLTGNSAEKGSALADMTGYSEFRLFDCTISDNMAAFPASTGSCAIFVGDGRSFMATDCFVTDNVGSGVLASGFVPRVT
ncbi:MAG TPA: right-handed parallel beta-helix repeat-containing protein, partial [Planctomycetota bacterium]|nr:right-handed parallel beta-helix repeat-containing protein [Planctomycetota bacterium]